MHNWTVRRLTDERGLTLVEMMVALLILAVVMFALLGGLMASAQSVLDQQLRAEATRVATQELESARWGDFDDLDEGTTTQTVTTSNGREMTLERTVAWIDAFDPDAGTNEDVKQVTVTIRWEDRGRDREVVYSTGIAQPDPELVGGQLLLATVDPGAREVDDDGVPTGTVTLDATPEGFAYVGNMTGRWSREDGTLANVQLSQVGGESRWTAEMPPEDLTWALEPGDNVDIEITVYAGGRQGTAVLTLYRQGETDPDPSLTAASVEPQPIMLTNPPGGSNNCHTNRCKNVDAVTMQVTVTPFTDDQVIERVFVEYDLRDATSPTERDLSVQADGTTWSTTVPANDVQFAPGTAQPFNFMAVYDGGQVSLPRTVLVQVVHQ